MSMRESKIECTHRINYTGYGNTIKKKHKYENKSKLIYLYIDVMQTKIKLHNFIKLLDCQNHIMMLKTGKTNYAKNIKK